MDFKRNKNVVMLLIKDFMYPYLNPRVYKEARSLVRNGYNVSVVCSGCQGRDVPQHERYEEINVFRVFQAIPPPTIPIILRLPAYGKFVFKIIKKSRQLNPDIIHCHDLDTLAAGVGLKLLIRKPLIFDAHEDFPSVYESRPEFLHSSRMTRLLVITMAQIMRLYEKVLIRFANRVIAAELLYTGAMKKHYGISPAVIMNFPNLDSFNPSVDASSIIKQYELEGKIVISQIGAIGVTRGTFETLAALQYLEYNNLRCFLIGKTITELRCKIREAIEKYNIREKVILLLDGIRHEDIPQYYKASDITMALLYPVSTYVTSIPTKLYESLAMGVPVVAADLPHIRKIIDTHEVGLCANSQDPKDIAEKLNALISDQQKRKAMGQKGLKIAREALNWSKSEEKLLETYDSIPSSY